MLCQHNICLNKYLPTLTCPRSHREHWQRLRNSQAIQVFSISTPIHAFENNDNNNISTSAGQFKNKKKKEENKNEYSTPLSIRRGWGGWDETRKEQGKSQKKICTHIANYFISFPFSHIQPKNEGKHGKKERGRQRNSRIISIWENVFRRKKWKYL